MYYPHNVQQLLGTAAPGSTGLSTPIPNPPANGIHTASTTDLPATATSIPTDSSDWLSWSWWISDSYAATRTVWSSACSGNSKSVCSADTADGNAAYRVSTAAATVSAGSTVTATATAYSGEYSYWTSESFFHRNGHIC